MFRSLGTLMVVSTTLFFSSVSIGSSSIEETVKKRIEMFKSSATNLKKLNKLIRLGNIKETDELVDFHINWSEEMFLLFPVGSEASTSNGSDASADIWLDTTAKHYNLLAILLLEHPKSNHLACPKVQIFYPTTCLH